MQSTEVLTKDENKKSTTTKKAVEKETTPRDYAMNRRAEIKVCFFEEQ